jgi:hypothetical protein
MRCSSFTCRTPSITHSPIVSRRQTLHNRPPSYTIRNTQHFIADLIKAGPGRPRHTPSATHSTQACRPPLQRMCVSASRMALYAANTRRATRSGWRKPAVVSRNAFAAATSQLSRRGDQSVVCARTPLQPRYSHPRRAHARRSCEPAFVHRKNRFFTGKRSHPHTRAGGVSPPWFATATAPAFASTPPAVSRDFAEARPASALTSHPRRADARRSCELRSDRKNRFSPARFVRNCNCVTHTHGGLTPAALVNLRSCIAKIVFRRQTFAPGHKDVRNANSKRGNPARCRCKRGFRPAPGSRRSLDESVRNCNCVTHTHGRLTCAALDSAVVLRQTSVGVHRNRGPSPTTAG